MLPEIAEVEQVSDFNGGYEGSFKDDSSNYNTEHVSQVSYTDFKRAYHHSHSKNKLFDIALKEEQEMIKSCYDRKLRKLSSCQKFYLWLHRNFINSIMFRRSTEHLDDIVE